MVTKTALRMLEGTVLTNAKSETSNSQSILRFSLSTGDTLDINMSDLLKNLGYISSVSKQQVLDALGYTPVNKAGDTMTGGLGIASAGNGSIELGRTDGVANTPFIDFHAGATVVDYDVRIITTNPSGVLGGGRLEFHCSRMMVPSGSAATPGITFNDDNAKDTGLYHVSDGNIGMAMNGVHGITFGAGGNITAVGDISGVSDRRLKDDIVTISNALAKIHQLNGVTYDRIDGKVKWRQTGLIAQDVQAVMPEAVKEDEKGFLSVAYGNLAGLAFEGIKEVDNKVEALTNALNSAMELINSLKEEVAKLKGV